MSVCEQVFAMDALACKTMQYLPFKDSAICTVVCRAWAEFTSKNKECYYTFNVCDFCWDDWDMWNPTRSPPERCNLSKFSHARRVQIEPWPSEFASHFSKFATNFKHIEHLDITMDKQLRGPKDYDPKYCQIAKDLLQNHCNNLKTLHFRGSIQTIESMQFESLETLILESKSFHARVPALCSNWAPERLEILELSSHYINANFWKALLENKQLLKHIKHFRLDSCKKSLVPKFVLKLLNSMDSVEHFDFECNPNFAYGSRSCATCDNYHDMQYHLRSRAVVIPNYLYALALSPHASRLQKLNILVGPNEYWQPVTQQDALLFNFTNVEDVHIRILKRPCYYRTDVPRPAKWEVEEKQLDNILDLLEIRASKMDGNEATSGQSGGEMGGLEGLDEKGDFSGETPKYFNIKKLRVDGLVFRDFVHYMYIGIAKGAQLMHGMKMVSCILMDDYLFRWREDGMDAGPKLTIILAELRCVEFFVKKWKGCVFSLGEFAVQLEIDRLSDSRVSELLSKISKELSELIDLICNWSRMGNVNFRFQIRYGTGGSEVGEQLFDEINKMLVCRKAMPEDSSVSDVDMVAREEFQGLYELISKRAFTQSPGNLSLELREATGQIFYGCIAIGTGKEALQRSQAKVRWIGTNAIFESF